ncbi:MAG: glycosyltransferase [Candidatus Accumulibacter sp.]|uniref:glycosyltransferase n=1 Tax=Accumulibacter sp. TaxID=2053492 RepID=UPI00287ABACC|nr:glycosyltransferase [Accumulibacter sp.]MDS4013651.1 glycosyltransferase [Accumulibacter sp.]
MHPRPTVLFIADAVTLAHAARPCALARKLDRTRFSAVLACDQRYRKLLSGLDFPVIPLASIASERFLAAAASGRPLYDAATLRAYVRDDLDLLNSVRPNVVVGDHRLSLSVSARIARVPYLNIINAYWSPYAVGHALPVPDLPVSRWLGARLAEPLFGIAWPLASAWHCRPLNRVRAEHGLPSLGHDWFRAYTDADHTLYADASELVPTLDRPANHTYLGPIQWSPDVALPQAWDSLPTDRPLIYATMGSSGDARLLQMVFDALADLPITLIVTTAGKALNFPPPENACIIDYAPGHLLAERADLMICNGGSLSVYQSLIAGKPLIGIASHMDQHLSMVYVERAGVGRRLRSDALSVKALRQTVEQLLIDPELRRQAIAMAKALAGYQPATHLGEILAAFC